jgi:hypothetical protein
MKTLIPLAVLAAGMASAEVPEYNPERYDVILERSPFGADPLLDVANPEQQAAAAAAAAAKELRLCFLLESESGDIRAGFQNLKAKPGDPKSVILMVGESFMGMKLLDIDLAGSQATLESRGESVVFELSKAPAPAKAPAAAKPEAPQRKFGGGFRRREPPQPQPQPQQPPEPELSPEEQEKRRAEIRKNLQDYQMEVIRQGMPPLPIPLTPEMDDQLVAEGVLPPMEGEEGVEGEEFLPE